MPFRETTETKTYNPFSTLNLTLLLVSLPLGILNFMLPIYGEQVGANAVEIGLFFSVYSLMTVLLRPLVGGWMDRLGRRWFFISGLAAYGLSMAGFAYSAAVPALVFARALQGIATALLWLAANAIVADLSSAEKRASAFGAISQSANQGGIIGTFIGFSVLFSMGLATGWNILFIGYAITCFAAAFIAWRRIPETRPDNPVKSESSLLDGLRVVLRSRALVVLMLIGLVTGASAAMISPILMIYLQEKFHANVPTLAWAFLPSALVWATLPTRLGKLADRFGRKPLMALALLVNGVNAYLIPHVSSLVSLTGLWVIEALCFAASDPASQALVTDLTGEHQRGRVFGVLAFSDGLGAVIGPLAGGWLYDNYSQAAPFIANSLVLILSAAAIWFMLKEH